MKILALAASNSKASINKALIRYCAQQMHTLVPGAEVEVIDINDFDAPIYSIDYEKEQGVPEPARALRAKFDGADGILISFAEHNGIYVAAWKSLFDWMTRLDGQIYDGKSLVLLATSPGGRGGAGVVAHAEMSVTHFGGKVLSTLAIAKFYDVFDLESGVVTDAGISEQLSEALAAFSG
ncbi:MAG: NAD(P)H-dependent oxidoreductase [Pseudomonadota bacterium]